MQILLSQKPFCFLITWYFYFKDYKTLKLSMKRPMGGIDSRRYFNIPTGKIFRDRNKAEDTTLMNYIRHRKLHCLIDDPNIYLYVYHGDNTWDMNHF